MYGAFMWVLWIGTHSAEAKDWNITPNGTNDALYNAIKQAQSGDVITLHGGIFKECINSQEKDLKITAANGAQITGNGSCAAVITVTKGELHLENIALSHNKTCLLVQNRTSTVYITGGTISQCGSSVVSGGGISVTDGKVVVNNTKISGNQASKGAGIYGKNAVIQIDGSIISDNHGQIGGALYAETSEVTINNTRIIGNDTKSGGFGAGLALRTNTQTTITNSSLQNNHSQGKGGAIYIDTTEQKEKTETNIPVIFNRIHLHTVVCQGNSASFGSSTGGCLYARGKTDITIENSTISDNLSVLSGAGLALHDIATEVHITSTQFSKNRARGGEGGAIVMDAQNADVAGALEIASSTFSENKAETYGGAVSLGNLLQPYGSLNIKDSMFTKNQAMSSQSGAGGAVYYVSSSPYTFLVQRTKFENNQSELAGGALYIVQPQTARISDSTFFHNAAEGASTSKPRYGGAVMVDSAKTVHLEKNKFCHNRSTSTGDARKSGVGGAVYVQKSEAIEIKQNSFWENMAQEKGGAIAVDQNSALGIHTSIFAANSAMVGGGAWIQATNSTVEDSIFAYTQIGKAVLSDTGKWNRINWYNNPEGHASFDIHTSTSSISVSANTENAPKFPKLQVDGVCDDIFQ